MHVVSAPCKINRHSVIWTLLLHHLWHWKHDPHHQVELSPNLAELEKKYADSCVEFGLIENSNRMKCTICPVLVTEEVLMPDDLKQYLITKHSEYQYDQQRVRERPHGNIFFPARGPWAWIIFGFPDLNWVSQFQKRC